MIYFAEDVFKAGNKECLIALWDSKRKIDGPMGPMNNMKRLFCVLNFVSYTTVHITCFEEVYFHIRNQSGCFCEISFLQAGLYCSDLTTPFSNI